MSKLFTPKPIKYAFSYKWTVPNVLTHPVKPGELYIEDRETFQSNAYGKLFIIGRVHLPQYNPRERGDIGVHLTFNFEPSTSIKTITTSFEIQVMGRRDFITKKCTIVNASISGHFLQAGCYSVLECNELLTAAWYWLDDGNLKLNFKGEVRLEYNPLRIEPEPEVVMLKSNGRKVPCCKKSLIEKSSRFKQMFDLGTAHNLIDFGILLNGEELLDFADYVNKGKTTNLGKTCQSLKKLAEDYEMDELLALCISRMNQ